MYKRLTTLMIIFSILNIGCINDKSPQSKKVDGGVITTQKFNIQPTPVSFQDEELEALDKYAHYKDIFYEYGNYWENVSNKNDCLLFDLFSSKLIQFKDFSNLNSPNNSNKVFFFIVKNSNPIEIIGEFGFKDSDTIMNWKFDENRKILVNNIGDTFKQVKYNLKN